MLKENEIANIYGKDYKEMTKALLSHCELADIIADRSRKIGLKPNLVAPTPPELGATTHREVLAGIIEYLKEHGFDNITIMEGSWVGDRTSDAFEVCGYGQLTRDYGVEFVDAQKEKSRVVDCGGMKLNICECAFNVDFLIGVPVMKGHCQTRMTCALKNMKGLLPNSEKRHFHAMGLHKPIGHLGLGIRQDFIVVDHICGDLDFEDGGNPVVCDCVFAGRDPVLIDSYVCSLMGLETSDVPYIDIAAELGVGKRDLADAMVYTLNEGVTSALSTLARPEKHIVELKEAVHEVDSCSACYGTLIPVLDRLREEGLLDALLSRLPDGRIHIGQGLKGQTGFLGIGNCTKDFTISAKGCPPSEEEIYDVLKRIIAVPQFFRGRV